MDHSVGGMQRRSQVARKYLSVTAKVPARRATIRVARNEVAQSTLGIADCSILCYSEGSHVSLFGVLAHRPYSGVRTTMT
jgi:hypothetical protein